jgi:hypothetical protein
LIKMIMFLYTLSCFINILYVPGYYDKHRKPWPVNFIFLTSFNQACRTDYTAQLPLQNVSSLCSFFSDWKIIEWIIAYMVGLFRNKIWHQ